MLDGILDLAIKLAVPTILAFGFVLAKKGCQIISKKLDVDISAKEWEFIDRLVEEAVRAVEEDSRTSTLSSGDKEELALARIKQSFGGECNSSCSELTLRTKVRAWVNKLYNHSKNEKIA
jgi:hypothetical protein